MTLLVMADDYGLSPSVSSVIRDLLAQGVLDGTTAMTTFPDWPEHGESLRPWAGSSGVHLTLTDHVAITTGERLPSFPALCRQSLTGQLSEDLVRAELSAQIARYADAVGRAPAVLDGHHHVHQLPVVRDVVVELAAETGAWVRTCWEPTRAILRRGVSPTKATGLAWAARGLRARLQAAGVATNEGFIGVYGFDQDPVELALRWLRDLRPGTVWMTHPGAVDEALRSRDRLTEGRVAEDNALRHPSVRDRLDQLRTGRSLRGS